MLIGRLRFRQLALLVAIDDHRNLRQAAAAVHLAQPSATKLVHDLERLFGFLLFERLPRGMQPTEPGTVVLGFARHLLLELKRFAHDIDDRKGGRHGDLAIGTPLGAAPEAVAHALAEIKLRRPLLAVKVFGEAREEIVNQLINGQMDMAVGYFSGILRSGKFECELLSKEALHVVVRKQHPLCRGPRLNLYDIERATWILQPLTMSTRQGIDRDFRQAGMTRPDNIVESNSISATLSLLLTSDAVTILPESLVRHHLRSRVLVRLPLTIGENLVDFGILTRCGERLSHAAAEFIGLLRHFANV